MRMRGLTSPRAGIALVLVAALLFSTSGTAQELASVDSTPLGVGGLRLIVGTLVLVVLMPLFGQRRMDVVRLWRTPAVLLGGGCVAVYQWAFFTGVQGAGVALGTLLTIGSAPVLTGLLVWLVFGRRPSLVWAAATAVAVAGLTMLSLAGATQGTVQGVVAALVAGLAVTGYTLAVTSVLDRGMHPAVLLASTCGIAGIALLPLLATQPLAWVVEPRGLLLVGYLGVATLAVSNTLQLKGIAILGPAPVATLMLAEPVLATTWGVTLLDERMSLVGVAGLVLVIVSLAVESATLMRSRHPLTIAPIPGDGIVDVVD